MSHRFAALVALTTLAAGVPAAHAAAGATSRPASRAAATPNTAPQFSVAQIGVPSQAIPIVADFNGDGRADIVWYGPGNGFDQLMLAAPGRTFTRHSISISGEYEPLEGDFNGDHKADILWYGPFGLPDHLWLGNGNGTFTSHTVSISGLYRPIVGDFNGDHHDDILWYAPGTAADYVWYGTAGPLFSSHRVTINGSYDFVTGGDFNGDGRTDLLFWSSRATVVPVWLGKSGPGFTTGALATPGAGSIPMVLNADTDAKSDILSWYGPGSIRARCATAASGFALHPLSISGTYQPLWANFDGDVHKLSDILWWSEAPGGVDAYWQGTTGGLHNLFYDSPHVDWSSHNATFGDFDGDGHIDICFYDPSGRDTSFYFG